MKLRLTVIIIILLNIMSCKMEGNKFKMIKPKGLSSQGLDLKAMLFLNSDTGFVVGSVTDIVHNPDFPQKENNQFAIVNRRALLFRTTDGGKNWIKKDLGNGYISNISRIGNQIFAFKMSEDYSSVFLYSSKDVGNNWDEGLSFPKNISHLIQVDNQLCATAADSSGVGLYCSIDDGKEWKRSCKLRYDLFDNPIEYNNKILYLATTQKGSYFPDKLILHNTQDSTENVVELPKEFNCYFLANCNTEIKLIGLKEGHIAVYSFKKDYKVKYDYSYEGNGDFFPQGYFNNNNEEWIIVGERGSIDVSNKIIKTKNKGNTWTTISFIKNKYIKPFCFYNDNDKMRAWFYAGSGQFQILK